MIDKLTIQYEMAALDGKDREFYDSLTDEEKKKFATFLMIRWGSTVRGGADLQEYYLVSTNLRLNKHFFELSKHPKLQWLLATTISPGIGNQRHDWISMKKKEATKGKKFLQEEFTTMKLSDIDLLASINSEKDIKEYAEQSGLTKEQIKKAL